MPTSKPVRIWVKRDGTVCALYSDDLASVLMEMGLPSIRRASHVEPKTVNGAVEWYADMEPSGGPMLGPFSLRQQALAAEQDWLEQKFRAGGL
jgi:hypothetical protein